MTPPPEWAATFVSNLHPISLLLAVIVPCVRATIRFFRNEKKCWGAKNACHDAAAGFVLPSFIFLTMASMIPNVGNYVDGHVFFLAGAWGIIYMLAELFGTENDAPVKPKRSNGTPSKLSAVKRDKKVK